MPIFPGPLWLEFLGGLIFLGSLIALVILGPLAVERYVDRVDRRYRARHVDGSGYTGDGRVYDQEQAHADFGGVSKWR